MHRAGELRKVSTPAEASLWAYLRGNKINGVNFRRQHAIDKYITDFCSPRKKLIIELDGSQHGEDSDAERTAFLEKQGYRVLRFWNLQVLKDIEGVLGIIKRALEE
jgi:very-short-patch-repair endonuclease